MHAWLLAIVAAATPAAAVQAPGAPQAKPHMHYEIWIDNADGAGVTDAQRLRQACSLASAISDRLNHADKADAQMTFYLAELNATACGKPRSK